MGCRSCSGKSISSRYANRVRSNVKKQSASEKHAKTLINKSKVKEHQEIKKTLDK